MKATERINIQRIKTSAASYSLGLYDTCKRSVSHADFFEYYSGSDGQQ
jgi:hypothetical protein